jgi:hypothetical protein
MDDQIFRANFILRIQPKLPDPFTRQPYQVFSY